MNKLWMVALALLLSACGSKLNGSYSDQNGLVTYKFESGNKVYVSALGVETEGNYSVDGDKVKVETNGQNIIYTIQEDGSLKTPFGNLTKK